MGDRPLLLPELERRTNLAIEWCNPLAAATSRTRGPADELGQRVHHNVGTQPAAVRGQQGQQAALVPSLML